VRDIIDDVASMRRAYRSAPASRPRSVEESAVVHAVVLNYNTPESTLLAVHSLLASRHRFATIMVVDNSDNVECGRWLRDVSDHVEYLSTDTNLGFAGGMNVGIRRALAGGATHVLLVNSDMTVPPDCLALLLAGLRSRPDAGIAGPIVLQRSSPDRIDSHGLSYNHSTGRMRHRLFGAPVTRAAQTAHEVDAVSGCLMLVERRVFERAGPLDEAYYFGFEDLDLCLRARRCGIVSLATPARALHEGALSMAQSSSDRYYYATRNHLRFARQLGRKERKLSAACRSLSILLLNAAGAMRSAPSQAPSRLLAVGRGAMDYWRGRFGPAG